MIEWILIKLGLRDPAIDDDDEQTERDIRRYAAFLTEGGGE